MIEAFFIVKYLHLLGAAILFGTGIGIAFFLWGAHWLIRDWPGRAGVLRIAVTADWIFTGTSGLVQPLSGLALIHLGGHAFDAGWLLATYGLYALAFLCWAPVVWLQIRLCAMAVRAAETGQEPPPLYRRYFRLWFGLGWPAFLALLAIYALMLTKPF